MTKRIYRNARLQKAAAKLLSTESSSFHPRPYLRPLAAFFARARRLRAWIAAL